MSAANKDSEKKRETTAEFVKRINKRDGKHNGTRRVSAIKRRRK